MKLSSIVLCCFIFLYPNVILSSFVEGTLIKTPQGLVPVERLKVGDVVTSCDAHNTLKEVRVLCITKHTTDTRLIICTEQGSVITCEDQFFYTDAHQWVPANIINEDYALCSCDFVFFQCGKSIRVCSPTTIYKVIIEFPHMLFISELQVLVHI